MNPPGGSLLRNVATNFLNYGLVLASAFLTLPILIGGLGKEKYGIWVLALESVGYFGYLDFGIQNGVLFLSATAIARRDTAELSRIAATAFWMLAAVGLALCAAGPLIATAFPHVFRVSAATPHEVYWTVLLTTFSIAITFPGDVLTALLNGSRRLDLANIIDSTTRVLSAAATAICVLRGNGLLTVASIQVGFRASSLLLALAAVRRAAPGLSLHPRHWQVDALKRLTKFGGRSLAVSIGQAIGARMDLVLVGMFLGVRAVALYALPRNLMEYGLSGVRAITNSFAAELTHLAAEDRSADLLKLFKRGSRISGLAICLLTAYIAAYGSSFLRLWQGLDFVTGAWKDRADSALLILAIAYVPRMVGQMNLQLLFATDRLLFLAWLSFLEAFVKLALSFFLVWKWSLVGMALCNLAPMYLGEGVVAMRYILRNFRIPAKDFRRGILYLPAAIGLAAYLLSAGLIRWFAPANWAVFLGDAAASALAGGLIAVLFGLDPEEREKVRAALRRLKPWRGSRGT